MGWVWVGGVLQGCRTLQCTVFELERPLKAVEPWNGWAGLQRSFKVIELWNGFRLERPLKVVEPWNGWAGLQRSLKVMEPWNEFRLERPLKAVEPRNGWVGRDLKGRGCTEPNGKGMKPFQGQRTMEQVWVLWGWIRRVLKGCRTMEWVGLKGFLKAAEPQNGLGWVRRILKGCGTSEWV